MCLKKERKKKGWDRERHPVQGNTSFNLPHPPYNAHIGNIPIGTTRKRQYFIVTTGGQVLPVGALGKDISKPTSRPCKHSQISHCCFIFKSKYCSPKEIDSNYNESE